jgi:acetolactate synthase regulatory subunit
VSSDDEYAFSVNQIYSVTENIVINVGNVDLKMIIDSGASCNIIGKQLWNFLKENHVACISSKSTKELYAYGTQEPLKIAGTFTATVKCNSKTIHDVEFVVIARDKRYLAVIPH